jgi:putative oxidoreductase
MDLHTAASLAPLQRLATRYSACAALLDALQPVLALAIRCYVAQVFFLSGLTKLRSWDSTLALFTDEYHVPLLSPSIAAVVGTAAELALPILLVLGIGTRATALALLVFNIVAAASYPDISPAGVKDHVLWGALLLVVAVHGPGRFALDGWLFRAR